MFKKIIKILAYAFGLGILVSIILIGITQSKFFKDRMRVIIVSAAANNINGMLHLGTIKGNFITGFSIDSVAIFREGEIFLSTGEISLHHDPFSMLHKTLTLRNLTIHNPTVKILKSNDGKWNINEIFPTRDTTEADKLDWTIKVQEIKVVGGSFTLFDSTREKLKVMQDTVTKYLDYRHFEVKNINTKFSGVIKDKNYKLSIKELSAIIPETSFELNQLTGDFAINEKIGEVKDLVLVTSKTRLKIDASLKELNLFQKVNLTEFENKPVELKVLASNIDLNELKSFLPPIYFLNGTAYVELEADGKFGDLSVKRLNLSTLNSSLSVTGNIYSLHQPKELYLNVRLDNGKIIPSDVDSLLPSFHIPKFKDIKKGFLNASYVGKPLDFQANVNLITDAGIVESKIKMDLRDSLIAYKGSFKTQRLDISKLIGKEIYSSSINSNFEIEGKGIHLNDLNASLKVEVDSSQFVDFHFGKSSIIVKSEKRQLHTVAILQANEMKTYINAELDFRDKDIPKYGIEASLTSVDISKLFNDVKLKSNLSLQTRITGAGKDVNSTNAEMHITLLSSVIGKHKFDKEDIYLSLSQTDSTNKSITLNSSFADVELNGSFKLDEIPNTFIEMAKSFTEAVKTRIGENTELSFSPEGLKHKSTPPHFNPFDYRYDIKVKNISAISNITGTTPYNFKGNLIGRVHGGSEIISLEGNIEVEDYFAGHQGSGILLSGANIRYQIDSLRYSGMFEKLSYNIQSTIGQLIINRTNITDINLKSDYQNFHGEINLTGFVDGNNKIQLTAGIKVYYDNYQIAISQLSYALDTEYVLKNLSNINFVIDSTGILTTDFAVGREGKERVSISGKYLHTGNFDLIGKVENYELDELKFLFRNAELAEPNRGLFGKVNSEIALTGDITNPFITLDLKAQDVSYRNTRFGDLTVNLKYANKYTETDVKIINNRKERTKPDFSIKGFFPIDLSFASVEERFPDEEINMRIFSEGFQVSLLDPLIPVTNDLNGILVCDVTIGGTPAEPKFFGSIEIIDTRFLLNTNNIYYTLSGKLIPEKDKINLVDFEFRNEKKDYRDGKVKLNGFFSLKDFKFDSFNLNISGQLLLLKAVSRRNISNIYGNLIAQIGSDGLHFTGTLKKSHINGTVHIKEAGLTFPPSRSVSYTGTEDVIKYVFIDDAPKTKDTVDLKHMFFYPRNYIEADTSAEVSRRESKFLAGLSYDIVIETRGTTNIRMIFNPTTNEELYAEIDGKLNLYRENGRAQIIGEISISDRSYYNFFKRFDATGKLKFFGEPENPELDIKASYTGFRTPTPTGTDTISVEQKVVINLNITGNRMEPKLIMGITIDDKDYADVITGGDLQSDAISFLFTSKFRDDLSAREKSDIVSNLGSTAGKSILAGATSTMLSGILTDFLRQEFGFIRSAEITYYGGNIQESADLRLSGQMFNAYWRFGGRIFNDINNANVSFILNFGDVFEAPKIRNLYLELERKTDSDEISLDKKLTNSARIYYRWSF